MFDRMELLLIRDMARVEAVRIQNQKFDFNEQGSISTRAMVLADLANIQMKADEKLKEYERD